jgi:hypothetical protein
MKRIVRFSLPLLIAISGRAFGNSHHISTSSKATDTNAIVGARKSLHAIALRGNLATFHVAYGLNFFDLNWNTIDGEFDHFEIERSTDGEHFEKLGAVSSKTDEGKQGQYYYRDHVKPVIARNKDFYYRLKQIEKSGIASYSKVLIARMYNTKTLASLSVTPDPIENDILVNVQLKEDSYVVMKVTDANGNLLLKKALHAENGSNTYTLDGTHELHAGLYTLEVVVNSKERLVMNLLKS